MIRGHRPPAKCQTIAICILVAIVTAMPAAAIDLAGTDTSIDLVGPVETARWAVQMRVASVSNSYPAPMSGSPPLSELQNSSAVERHDRHVPQVLEKLMQRQLEPLALDGTLSSVDLQKLMPSAEAIWHDPKHPPPRTRPKAR